jgi:uncharacterized membrane protein
MENWQIVLRGPYPAWIVGAGFALLTGLVVWQYTADAANVARWKRRLLLVLHVAAAAIVCAVFLQPVLVSTSPITEKESFVVLVDNSRSMDMPLEKGRKRIDSANSILREKILAELKRLFDTRVFTFSGGLQEMVSEPDAFEINEGGDSTNVSGALRDVTMAGPSGVLLVSDGCWNTGGDPRRLGASLAGRGIEIHSLSMEVGERPTDISVRDVRGRETIFLGDSLVVQFKIVQSGYDGRKVPTVIRETSENLAEKEVTLAAAPLARPVSFILVPEAPGRHTYKVGVPVQKGEVTGENNFASISVRVVEKEVNVLIVESEPRWEFRYVRNALERDPSTKVECLLLRPGVGPTLTDGFLPGMPKGKKELGKYDVVVMGDVNVRKMPSKAVENLVEFVRARGGGLVVIPGKNHGLAGYKGTALENILPAEVPAVTLSPGVLSRKPFSLGLTAVGKEHLLTRLDQDPSESGRLWKELPGGVWCCGVGIVKRGAQALVEHPYLKNEQGPLPLLVVQQSGNGKIVYIGWDGLWRWRKGLGEKHHYRFWAQLVRWIVKKHFEGDDPFVKVACDRDVCNVGEDLFVQAYVLDKDYYPLDGAEVYLLVSKEGETRQERLKLPADEKGWGIYRGSFKPHEPGNYTCRVVVPYHGPEPRKTTIKLRVEKPALEARSLLPDTALLKALASVTGGRYLKDGELPGLLDYLGRKTRSRVRTTELSLWDSWLLPALVALLLAVEWVARKRWGLC